MLQPPAGTGPALYAYVLNNGSLRVGPSVRAARLVPGWQRAVLLGTNGMFLNMFEARLRGNATARRTLADCCL